MEWYLRIYMQRMTNEVIDFSNRLQTWMHLVKVGFVLIHTRNKEEEILLEFEIQFPASSCLVLSVLGARTQNIHALIKALYYLRSYPMANCGNTYLIGWLIHSKLVCIKSKNLILPPSCPFRSTTHLDLLQPLWGIVETFSLLTDLLK